MPVNKKRGGKNSSSSKKHSSGKSRSQKKVKSKGRPEYVGFDPASRLDYLTGFHKRNVELKKKAQEKAIEFAKQEKREYRQLKRKRVGAALQELDKIEAIANGTWKPTDEEINEKGTDEAQDMEASLNSTSSFTIQSDKTITTVTVSEFDPSAL